jgi:hypothetical protein
MVGSEMGFWTWLLAETCCGRILSFFQIFFPLLVPGTTQAQSLKRAWVPLGGA